MSADLMESAKHKPTKKPKNQKQVEKLVAPPGIQLRRGKRSESIGFSFYFEGVEYRETLKLSLTKANVEYAINRRGEILNAIALGRFDYEKYFPNSLKARKLAEVRKAKEAAHPRNTTVEQLMKAYLGDRKRSLAPSSFNQYSDVTRTHILPKWKDTLIGDISTAEIRKWILSMPTKQKTIQANILPFNRALSRAKNDGGISCNPFDYIDLKEILHPDQRKSESDADPFDVDEIEKILGACTRVLERSLVAWAFGTGMRPSEYMALMMEHIDLRAGSVAVKGAFVDQVHRNIGKTDSALRKIDLRQLAVEGLSTQLHRRGLGELVLPHPITLERWTGDKQIRERWRRILKIAGVRYRPPYQTRHTFASSLLMLGEPPLYVASQMGHVDATMVYTVYGK
jgi:integrase